MKIEGLLFALMAVFFLIVAIVYWVLSGEWIGTAALTLSFGLGMMIAYYAWFTGRRIDPRPEDDLNAEPSDGAGELGFFSPHSWWPLPLALSAAVIFGGAVFGWWLVALGVVGLGISLVGFTFEYYRGERV